MSKTEFTFKVSGDTTIGKLVTSQKHPAATLELKDGTVTLNSREYLSSEPVSQVIVQGVKRGAILNITVERTERQVLTVTVDEHKVVSHLNWPSYRGEPMSFTFKRGQKPSELAE
ncbi:hypothetical protein CNR34_00128 [Pseudomonas phage nickie]|uniref:Uncharacterized protein n=1 Tax=Pseudomonas phage nickie TaxID=2048977 RepID=A0A2H4P7C8_9CAUD|nr:hypothetical protein FDJ16_gp037 [Pseudomonas phage nickie]ATW58061.1 hypothetical protein CNR34_00128 [Pseudomonas phage nickie]